MYRWDIVDGRLRKRRRTRSRGWRPELTIRCRMAQCALFVRGRQGDLERHRILLYGFRRALGTVEDLKVYSRKRVLVQWTMCADM